MEELDRLLKALKNDMPLCDAERFGSELYSAPRFSVFALVDTKEVALSRIFADLFDPRGRHGQGPLFLNALLRHLGLPAIHPRGAANVAREVPTAAGRRIDLVIDTGSALIGIENKPYSGEGYNQLRDYLDDLRARARGRPIRLIFISNRDPTIKDEALVKLPYRSKGDQISLCRLLLEQKETVRAANVRDFVAEFCGWIEDTFGEGNGMPNGMDAYVRAVMERVQGTDPDRKAIGAVLLARDDIHRELIDRIERCVVDRLSNRYSDFRPVESAALYDRLSKRLTPWGLRRDTWPINCNLSIETEGNNCSGTGYGVVALDPDTPEGKQHPEKASHNIAELTRRAQTVPGSDPPSAWWRWSCYANTPNWTPEFCARLLVESNGAIEQHDEVNEIAERLLALAEAISGDRPVYDT